MTKQPDNLSIPEAPQFVVMNTTNKLCLYHTFENSIQVLHFAICCWSIYYCCFDDRVQVTPRSHKIFHCGKLLTFIKENDSIFVTVRSENTDNIFEDGD